MKYLRATVLLACLLAVVGCEQRVESLVVENGFESIKDTTVGYFVSDEGIFFTVWCGVSQSTNSYGLSASCSSTSSTKEVEIHGSFRTTSSKGIDYRCRTSDGENGTVVFDGAEYDLAEGGVFLVGEHNGNYSVSQLDLEFSREHRPRYTLETLAKTDPRIAEFVGSFERLD